MNLLPYKQNYLAVVVSQRPLHDTPWIREVHLVYPILDYLSWNRMKFDYTGKSIENTLFDYRLKSFDQFSDQDKMWLFRDCLMRSPQYLSPLVQTYNGTAVEQESLFALQTHVFSACMSLDITWAQLNSMLQDNVVSVLQGLKNRTQVMTYISDQFDVQPVTRSSMPEWFKRGRTYDIALSAWTS